LVLVLVAVVARFGLLLLSGPLLLLIGSLVVWDLHCSALALRFCIALSLLRCRGPLLIGPLVVWNLLCSALALGSCIALQLQKCRGLLLM
ncbi:hypothetical protein U1Q18_031117, partial [Sarracenia purpurea var. burkii]